MFKSSINKLLFLAKNLQKEMWVRCCIYCFLALLPFLIGPTVTQFIPKPLLEIVSTDALQKILTVMASSMLAVTTFSLSIMVQAFHTAAVTTTPRASKLLMQDRVAQNALGAFIGSFLFSIVGIVGLSAEFYEEGIVVILFFLTLLMILIVIVMLLQWIRQLSKLGRVSVTIKLIEDALCSGIQSYVEETTEKISELTLTKEKLQSSFQPVKIMDIGYIQYIDYANINGVAIENNFDVYITATPGDFVDSTSSFLYVSRFVDKAITDQLLRSIVIDKERTFSQDPRYGFLLLTEVALRALSSGVNDPGTAIDAIHTQMRVFQHWVTTNHLHIEKMNSTEMDNDSCRDEKDSVALRVFANRVEVKQILEDMYLQLIQEATPHLTVSRALLRSLTALETLCDEQDKSEATKWLRYFEKILTSELAADQLKLLGYTSKDAA